jgi:hypothetical protein
MNIIKQIEERIITIENQLVMIDSDVASLYNIETKRINEAVKNNPDKFPFGYIIDVPESEWLLMKTKFSTSTKGGKTKLPKAFTEKGLYMLATILKGPIATQTTIEIIETFAKIRELGRNIKQLSITKKENEKQPLIHRSGELIAEILDDELGLSGTETTIELNFAVLKIKHTIKRDKKNTHH